MCGQLYPWAWCQLRGILMLHFYFWQLLFFTVEHRNIPAFSFWKILPGPERSLTSIPYSCFEMNWKLRGQALSPPHMFSQVQNYEKFSQGSGGFADTGRCSAVHTCMTHCIFSWLTSDFNYIFFVCVSDVNPLCLLRSGRTSSICKRCWSSEHL